ncbi:hypothetical protein IJ818_05770 [bacterium]|nr:hypothetical protein [bacterium]
MKKFITLLLIIFGISAHSVYAYTTQDEVYSEEAMINYGYSPDFVEMYNKIQARSNGEPYDYRAAEDPIYKYPPFKYLKHIIYYFDPSSDTSQFLRHEIRPYPGFHDY